MKWVSEEEYMNLTGLDIDAINDLCDRAKLTIKVEDGIRMIDPSRSSKYVPIKHKELSSNNNRDMFFQPEFVEKTIDTIMRLHEKILYAKDETIVSIKNENDFLKETLSSLQELHEEERKTIQTLQEQLNLSQQEVEFMRRKYKLMWDKTIYEHTN